MAKIANNNVTVNLMTVTPGMEVVSVQRVGLDFDVIRVSLGHLFVVFSWYYVSGFHLLCRL